MNAPVRQGIPLRPDPSALASSQRRAFIRACTSLALATEHRQRPDVILSKQWPDDALAPRVLKAAQSPTTSNDFPALQVMQVLPLLAPQAASARLLALATPVDLARATSVRVPYIGQSGRPVVPFIEEGKPFPITDLTTSGLVVGPTKKLLVASMLTNELQNASGDTAATIIGSALSISCEQSMDALLFSNAAATAAAPPGLLNGVVAVPSAGTQGAQGIADDLGALAQSIADYGINADDMIIVTTAALATKLRVLASLKFSNEVLSSSSIPAGEVIAVAAGGLVSAFDGTVSIETTEEATLHEENTAPADIVSGAAPGTLACPTGSLWQKDCLSVRVRGPCAWSVHPGSISWLTGAAW